MKYSLADVRLLESNKGMPKLGMPDGNTFCVQRERKHNAITIRYWHCDVTGCPVKIVERSNVFTDGDYVHNHAAPVGRIEAFELAATMRKRALDSISTLPSQLVKSQLDARDVRLPAGVRRSPVNYVRMIRRQRQKFRRLIRGPEAATLNCFSVAPSMFVTRTGSPIINVLVTDTIQILTADSSQAHDHDSPIYAFTTDYYLSLLRQSVVWYVDSTFKAVPTIFDAVMTIQCHTNDLSTPLIYFLLPSKSVGVMMRVFACLRFLVLGDIPSCVATASPPPPHMTVNASTVNVSTNTARALMVDDFSDSVMGDAFRANFANGVVFTSCFSFCRSMFAHIENELPELLAAYRRDAEAGEIRRSLSTLLSLMFVAPGRVRDDFNLICNRLRHAADNTDHHQQWPLLTPLLVWMEDRYIGFRRIDDSLTPVECPPAVWSQFDVIQSGLIPSSEHVVAYHTHLAQDVSGRNPNPSLLLEAIQAEIERGTAHLLDTCRQGVVVNGPTGIAEVERDARIHAVFDALSTPTTDSVGRADDDARYALLVQAGDLFSAALPAARGRAAGKRGKRASRLSSSVDNSDAITNAQDLPSSMPTPADLSLTCRVKDAGICAIDNAPPPPPITSLSHQHQLPAPPFSADCRLTDVPTNLDGSIQLAAALDHLHPPNEDEISAVATTTTTILVSADKVDNLVMAATSATPSQAVYAPVFTTLQQ